MEIKGDKRGLRILAHGFTEESDLIEDLRHTLKARAEFLGNAGLFVEVANLPLSAELFQGIAMVFSEFPALNLRGIQSPDPQNGLLTLDQSRTPARLSPQVIRHTIRSGQRVTHQGDLIIVGDVNPGATLMASGDVFVFGWLRGTVYAGQPETSSCSIYAMRFQPSQIKIGTVLALGDSLGEQPEFARVDNGLIVVEPWTDVHLPEAVTSDGRYRKRDSIGLSVTTSH
ncbi:MAG: septum site-determining protein MinC [Sulfobacillus benefaciens]|uniref:Probable septum site-determining protein MinC n=1 Tax=Sulfobacillus benefaciens TaxID=453960 RepID=A0A2T2XIJ7_9FIRM|nr:MAG: septum site-determining protein MinC [Sulfobacillus benefaciens]